MRDEDTRRARRIMRHFALWYDHIAQLGTLQKTKAPTPKGHPDHETSHFQLDDHNEYTADLEQLHHLHDTIWCLPPGRAFTPQDRAEFLTWHRSHYLIYDELRTEYADRGEVQPLSHVKYGEVVLKALGQQIKDIAA